MHTIFVKRFVESHDPSIPSCFGSMLPSSRKVSDVPTIDLYMRLDLGICNQVTVDFNLTISPPFPLAIPLSLLTSIYTVDSSTVCVRASKAN
jgi:hypothetical protein